MKVPKARRLKCGTWFIQLRLGGESIPVTGSTERACTSKARRIKAEYKDGVRIEQFKDPSPAPEPDPTPTLTAAIDGYIAARKNSLSPATVRGYRIIQGNRFRAYMETPMDQIQDWQAVYDSEIERLCGKTLKNSWGLLRSVYLYQFGFPMPQVDMLPVAKNERTFFDAEEISKFLTAVSGAPCETGALLALSSLRCSEILDLSWDDVDLKHDRLSVHGAAVLDENNILIHKETNKTDASWRYVPIFIPQLHDVLQGAKDQTGYVVHYQTESGLIRAINRVCQRADLPAVGIHGLRHSFASLCVHLGIPEETAMQIGGWSDFTTMRKIYTHISQRDKQDHISQLKGFYSDDKKAAT